MDKLSVVHVHIGKCAGGSVNIALRDKNINFTELHCGESPSLLENILATDDGSQIYLLTVRDPIKRVVSSFNWDLYEKIIVQKSTNLLWNQIYNKFRCVDELACALSSDNKDLKNLAEKAFTSSYLHMHLGISWYLPESIVLNLPPKRTYVVATEFLLEDFNSFLTGAFPHLGIADSISSDKDAHSFINKLSIDEPKFLSDLGYFNLKKQLKSDYSTLDVLVARGITKHVYK